MIRGDGEVQVGAKNLAKIIIGGGGKLIPPQCSCVPCGREIHGTETMWHGQDQIGPPGIQLLKTNMLAKLLFEQECPINACIRLNRSYSPRVWRTNSFLNFS